MLPMSVVDTIVCCLVGAPTNCSSASAELHGQAAAAKQCDEYEEPYSAACDVQQEQTVAFPETMIIGAESASTP